MPIRKASARLSGRVIRVLALWLACGGFPIPGLALPNYCVRLWQAEQGLPQNKVTAIVQTRDGFLWMGTYSGLARFDGVHFDVFDQDNTPELHRCIAGWSE